MSRGILRGEGWGGGGTGASFWFREVAGVQAPNAPTSKRLSCSGCLLASLTQETLVR